MAYHVTKAGKSVSIWDTRSASTTPVYDFVCPGPVLTSCALEQDELIVGGHFSALLIYSLRTGTLRKVVHSGMVHDTVS